MVDLKTVEVRTTVLRNLATYRIETLDGSYGASIHEGLVSRLCANDNDIPPAKRDTSKYPHAADVKFIDIDADVELILCISHVETWLFDVEIKRGPRHLPFIVKTAFGWTIMGGSRKSSTNSIACNALDVDNDDLRQNLDRIFYQDFPNADEEEQLESPEDKEAIRQLQETLYFDNEKKKYRIGLPWKGGRELAASIMNAVNSRATALRRLRGTRNNCRNDPLWKERVCEEMEKFVTKGFASKIHDDKNDAAATTPRWYLPLHVVEKNGKTRICHDAKAVSNGVALNDLLHGKIKLGNELNSCLMLFRLDKYAFTTDICSFFHNVLVDKKDADAFRYFWYTDDKLNETELLRFNAHIFGSAASSFVTSFVLRHHAEKMRGKYGDVTAGVIGDRSYVDDMNGTRPSVEALKQLKIDVTAAMAEGGFPLAKWNSNAPEALGEDAGTALKNIGANNHDGLTKILGMCWETRTDMFTFVFDEEKTKKVAATPRELVAIQASLFDPLGFISPFQLLGRRMLQRSMIGKKGWDSPLDPKLKIEFQNWTASIPLLAKLKIPRWWATDDTVDHVDEQLHVFGDAATSGFGAVAYRRVVGPTGAINVTILTARSHVVPLDSTRASHHNSVPRLELVAAVKAVELRQFCERTLKRKFPVVKMWSDSQCVLKQIADTSTRQKQFFENRLSIIRAGTSPDEWNFIDGTFNPGDLPSRGIKAYETEKWNIFHYGPKFLRLPESQWPNFGELSTTTQPLINVNSTDVQTTVEGTPTDQSHNDIIAIAEKEEFYVNKVTRIAVIVRVIDTWRKYKRPRRQTRSSAPIDAAKTLSISLWNHAEKILIRAVQQRHFRPERKTLEERSINAPNLRRELTGNNSQLRAHNPFLDKDGLMRVGSRLTNSSLDPKTQCPIILPKKDDVVDALIRHYHAREIHAGAKQTLAQLRQKFWILQGLQRVRSIVTKCLPCQKAFKRPLSQKMAPLPAERTTPGAPFEDTGVDFMGPFLTKLAGKGSHKIWVAVFTCFRSRAVHAEVVSSLDASACVNAIVRFASRRPGVRRFHSDRGTNLTAADKIINGELEAIRKQSTKTLRDRNLEWNFNPANAPHRGGTWERIIGMFKKHLKVALPKTPLRFDTFQTIIVDIEGIVNRRPLTAVSPDSRDCEPLSPANILYPSMPHTSTLALVQNVGSTQAEKFRFRWRQAQAHVNAFWKAWSKEYLTLLHSRSKWQTTKKNLKVGDLVLIVDELAKRNEWKLARVLETFGSNDHIRAATVQRADRKCITRDRTKLILLELDAETG